jgi:hypothetical protein
MEAGRRTGPRRRVALPAPEEKQGLRGEPDDGGAADRVVCPAGGEEEGGRAGITLVVLLLLRGYPDLGLRGGP